MAYILKQYDTPLLRFETTRTLSGVSARILWVNEEKKYLLPLDLECNEESLLRWMKRRTIPANRAYVQNFLSKLGLNEKDYLGIIEICKGLSLNDSYWIVDEDFDGSFAKNNLYDNRFSRVLSYIAFTGYGSSVNTSLLSSPEFTTNGMLPKAWRRKDGKIYLYKGGTVGFANSGKEPYSEFYAYQVAQAMGITAVQYGLSKWKDRLCSTCEIFTSKDTSFMPIGRLVTSGGIEAVISYYQALGNEYTSALADMFVFDAIICNTDRHFGNFGFLVDNETNKIVAPAPLFDHGLSLFHYEFDEDMDDLIAKANVLMPATYTSFKKMANRMISGAQRSKLHKLANFKFKKHSKYNLSYRRLEALSRFVAQRASLLLGEQP